MTTENLDSASIDFMLATIRQLEERRLEIDWQITTIIKACVSRRATWKEIGAALGVSPQAAWSKHRAPDAPEVLPGQGGLDID